MKKQHIGLVFQGGGALGAYECGVVKALHEQYPNFLDNLDIVSGISIGAVNAAVIVGARDDPIKTLEKMWLEHFSMPNVPFIPREMQSWFTMRGMWGTPGMSMIRPELFVTPWMVNSTYDTTLLLRTLKDLVDIDKINRSHRRLMVAASDLEIGELTWFENQKPRSFSYDMILASGAWIPNFPAIRVIDQDTGRESHYCDGGLLYNLPLSQVTNALEAYDPLNFEVERIAIIVELFPPKGQVPTNILEAQNRATQMILSSKVELDKKFFDKIDAYSKIMKIVDSGLPPEIKEEIEQAGLREAYDQLKGHKNIQSIVITSQKREPLTGGGDFSRATIEDRIERGYQDTCDVLRTLNLTPVMA